MDTQRQASPFARKNVVYLCAAFCCLLWGSAYPSIKSGYDLFQIATDDIPSKIVEAVMLHLNECGVGGVRRSRRYCARIKLPSG